MSGNWTECPLASLCDEITVGHVGSMTKEYRDEGIPFFRSKNIREHRIDWDDIKYISHGFHQKLKKSTLRAGDVAVVRTGKPGTACVIPDDIVEANCSDLVIMRVNSKYLSPHFLSYYLNSVANHQINSRLVGAVQQHFNVGAAKKLSITIPARSEQNEIVKVLKDLDDKIQINHQINQSLEQIAQAIFKSWFVDFEPVKAKIAALAAGGSEEDARLAAMQTIAGKTEAQLTRLQSEHPDYYAELRATADLFPSAMQESEFGEIPAGWGVAPFSHIARLDTTSVKPAQYPEKEWEHYSIPAFDDGQTPAHEFGADIKSNKYKVHRSSVLVSKLNPHFPRTWVPLVEDESAAICSTEFMPFVPLEESHRPFVAGMVTSAPFQSGIMMRVTGSTGSRQRAQPKQVAVMDVVRPPTALIAAYSKLADPLMASTARNISQSQTLAKLRDTLLPKLLSGEITVPQADSAVTEAVDA